MSINDPASIERATSARLRILLILWAAQMMSLLLFTLLSVFILHSKASANASLFWVYLALGLFLVVLSFPLKQKFLAEALAEQDGAKATARLQSGYIVAWALCEAAGLFGVMTAGTTNSPYYYLLFIIAALGFILHFPRREQVTTVSFRNRL